MYGISRAMSRNAVAMQQFWPGVSLAGQGELRQMAENAEKAWQILPLKP
jgi:hypothetical protein